MSVTPAGQEEKGNGKHDEKDEPESGRGPEKPAFPPVFPAAVEEIGCHHGREQRRKEGLEIVDGIRNGPIADEAVVEQFGYNETDVQCKHQDRYI